MAGADRDADRGGVPVNGYPIRSIHQVELTSRCNLRCRYCPSPNLKRPKVDMAENVFARCLELALRCVVRGSQRELNLAGIGESTLHPRFAEYVARAREALGFSVDLTMATNGILITDELARKLKPHRPRIWVSLHRPEKAGPAIMILKKHGLLAGVSADPSIAAINWAGQVEWHTSHGEMTCAWIKTGRAFVMADGRISTCCLDASGAGVVGTVFDDLDKLRLRPYDLCEPCTYDLDPEVRTMMLTAKEVRRVAI